MSRFCGNCFNETLNEQGICTLCGFDAESNRQIAPHALPAGTILNGRYIIGRVLGQGGFGITYTAKDHQTGQVVAVKEFFPDSMAMRSSKTEVTPFQGERGENFAYGRETFLQEAQTMAEFIGNPNIVRVYSYFEENGTAYFAMEYVDGESYLAYLKARGGKIPVAEALKILYPVMDALSAVHEKNIIHRDVTPDNIYISKNGTVKLLDFGAARYSLGNASRSLDVILKHGFAPREQYKRRGRQGPYTDVYSLGATLYYSITGIRPDDALERVDEDTVVLPGTMGVKISREQETVMMKAMAVDPEDRYQTMAEFRRALSGAKPAQKDAPAKKETASPKPQKSKVEKRTSSKPVRTGRKPAPKALWAVAAAAVVLVCIGAVSLLVSREKPALSADPTRQPTAAAATEATPDEVLPLTPEEIAYNEAVDLFYQEEYGKAAIAFGKLGDFRDAREISFKIWDAIAKRQTILADVACTMAIKEDGTVIACGAEAPEDLSEWKDIVSIASPPIGSYFPKAALRSDGRVMVYNTRTGSRIIDRDGWTDIVAIECVGYHLVGLRSDGTLVSTSREFPNPDYWVKEEEETEYLGKIAFLTDIVEFGEDLVKYVDGTVMVDFEVSDHKDIIARAACHEGSAWLRRDGTVFFEYSSEYNKTSLDKQMDKDLSSWTDIVSISGSGSSQFLGLKSDGRVVATGKNDYHQLDVEEWTDIAAINSGWYYSAGLKKDGTLVAAGSSKGDALKPIRIWTGLKVPADREALLAQIRPRYITASAPRAEVQNPDVDISQNILMGLGVSDLELSRISTRSEAKRLIPEYEIFNLSIKRKEVRTVTFLDTLKDAPANAVDASALGDNKVKAWATKNGELYDVFVGAEGGIMAPEDCSWLFGFLPNLTELNFNDAFDTSNVTSMLRMFDTCGSLKKLDLSSFDTSNVNMMSGMFIDCSELEEVDVTSFNTKNVSNMSGMFSMCKNLHILNLTGFDTSGVISMESMFLWCESLKKLDLSNFDVTNVTSAFNMFRKCPAPKPDWYDYTMD